MSLIWFEAYIHKTSLNTCTLTKTFIWGSYKNQKKPRAKTKNQQVRPQNAHHTLFLHMCKADYSTFDDHPFVFFFGHEIIHTAMFSLHPECQ